MRDRAVVGVHDLPGEAVAVRQPAVACAERVSVERHEGEPPSVTGFHSVSTSSGVSRATRKDTDGLKVNNGPALGAWEG